MNTDAMNHATRQQEPRSVKVTCPDCGQVAEWDEYPLHQTADDRLGGFGGREARRVLVSGGCDCAARKAAAAEAARQEKLTADRTKAAAAAEVAARLWDLPEADDSLPFEHRMDGGVDSVAVVLAEARRRNEWAARNGEPAEEYRVVVGPGGLTMLSRAADAVRVVCVR